MSFIAKISLYLCAFGGLAFSPALAAPAEKSATPAQIAAESKRANEFFDQKFDEYVACHPQVASQLGLKIDYDKWDDLSDAANAQDLATIVAIKSRAAHFVSVAYRPHVLLSHGSELNSNALCA